MVANIDWVLNKKSRRKNTFCFKFKIYLKQIILNLMGIGGCGGVFWRAVKISTIHLHFL